MSLLLRAAKGAPLTNAELDANFELLSNGLYGMRNRIINGAADLNQRAAVASVNSATGRAYGPDRWAAQVTNSTGVVELSAATSAPVNSGFKNCVTATVTTADAAVGATDLVMVQQRIEGYNIVDLVGQTFTYSFWGMSPVAGVHCVNFGNNMDKSYVAEYTINAANTWEYKAITVPGGIPALGNWNFNTGNGLMASFVLMAGTTYQGAAGVWANYPYATANQVNCMATAGNVFRVTGVQLERGKYETAFDRRQIGIELALCQRYYQQLTWSVEGYSNAAFARVTSPVAFPVPMRAVPTRTRVTTGTSVNVRGSDPASYAVPLSVTASGCTPSIESNAAGYAQAINFTDGFAAEL